MDQILLFRPHAHHWAVLVPSVDAMMFNAGFEATEGTICVSRSKPPKELVINSEASAWTSDAPTKSPPPITSSLLLAFMVVAPIPTPSVMVAGARVVPFLCQ